MNENQIKGTVEELCPVLTINGSKLDRVTLSVLLRILQKAGLATVEGTCRPSGKGKPSNIWLVKKEALLIFVVNYGEANRTVQHSGGDSSGVLQVSPIGVKGVGIIPGS